MCYLQAPLVAWRLLVHGLLPLARWRLDRCIKNPYENKGISKDNLAPELANPAEVRR